MGKALKKVEEKVFTVDDAISVIRRDYYQDVKEVALNIVDAIAKQEITDEDALHDYLHESIDGHQRVIYTFQAKLGLLASDEEDAAVDELGEEEASKLTIEQKMFYAMLRDVQDELGDVGALFGDGNE